MPPGLSYVGSWIEANFDRCFQIMESDDASSAAVAGQNGGRAASETAVRSSGLMAPFSGVADRSVGRACLIAGGRPL
jgi:hypothetical protein